jgi:hypothetical protein
MQRLSPVTVPCEKPQYFGENVQDLDLTSQFTDMYSHRNTRKGMVEGNCAQELNDVGVEKIVETRRVLYSQIRKILSVEA